MAFQLPPLPYPYDALAPYMSAETLEYHHDKHHAAYVNTGNDLMKGSQYENMPVEDVVRLSYSDNPKLFNNAGQHYNHIHFWQWMKPNGGGAIPGELERKIAEDFGSVDKMKEEFMEDGAARPRSPRAVSDSVESETALDSFVLSRFRTANRRPLRLKTL